VNGPLCPVAAVLAYLVRKGSRSFILRDGKVLTRTRFVHEIKVANTSPVDTAFAEVLRQQQSSGGWKMQQCRC